MQKRLKNTGLVNVRILENITRLYFFEEIAVCWMISTVAQDCRGVTLESNTYLFVAYRHL